jgi:hypothetical protein
MRWSESIVHSPESVVASGARDRRGPGRTWRCLIPLLLAVALLLGPTAPVSAQVTRADTAAVLLRAARDFQSEGRREVAEALLRYASERFGDTPAGAEAFQALQALRASPLQATTQSSRVELQVWSTLYGLWLGVAVPGALGASGSEPYGLGLLLGGPGGFLAGRALANSRPLSEGQVRAITFGGTWGTWQGFGWARVLDIGEREVCDFTFCYTEEAGSRTKFSSLVVGGLAGIATGSVLSRRPISPGTATTVNFGAFWGTWFGVAGSVLADLEGDDFLATTLLGGNAGLVATALLAPGWDLTRERARLISIAGVIGGLAGGGLDLLIQPDNEKVAIGIPLATSIAGLAMGAVLTRDRPSEENLFRGSRAPGAGDNSLFYFDDGRLGVGMPAPLPVMIPVEGPRGAGWKPGLGMTLFQAVF